MIGGISLKRADRWGEPCEDTECRFGISGVCHFGLRNTHGCFQTDDLEGAMQSLYVTRKQTEMARFSGEDKGVVETGEDIMSKCFRFIYKGHEYSYRDSARAINACPHCGFTKPTHDIFEENSDYYLGSKSLDDTFKAVCFECPKCFKKFFYHDRL